MTKELIIEARKTFGKNPIRVVCDNMIIAYDHTPEGIDMIWDDDKELAIFITPTISDNLVGSASVSPLKSLYIPYEMIQYIEGHLSKADAMAYAEKLKSTIGETQYKKLLRVIADNEGAYNYKYVPVNEDSGN